MRLLYLYPEEWTGRRAREVHTLATCAALAESGVEVTLATAGGLGRLHGHLAEAVGATEIPGLHLVALSRALGPVRSASIFSFHFRWWLRRQARFDWAYLIHLKAAPMLTRARIPYIYEAHEIFAETPQKSVAQQTRLHGLERRVLADAALRVATSEPLARALGESYELPDDFTIAPNAGLPPLDRSLATPDGPFVYCGSIADWKGLDPVIQAASDARVPLKIVGGTKEEWRRLGEQLDVTGVAWQPRVSLAELPQALARARAGLIPTLPETPSGRYSCPMKLFDYARCGLQVISTELPSLQSLDVGSWCARVSSPTREAWREALEIFRHDGTRTESARVWSSQHTWAKRAELLVRAFARHNPRA